jgi:hypothetical protein
MAKKRSEETSEGSESMQNETATDAPASKMEAVRRTLAAGIEHPAEGVQYIRDHFNMEVSKGMYSAYKAQIRAKAERKSVRPRGWHKAQPVELAPNRGHFNGDDALDAARQVKDLVARFGSDTVRGLVDLFDDAI